MCILCSFFFFSQILAVLSFGLSRNAAEAVHRRVASVVGGCRRKVVYTTGYITADCDEFIWNTLELIGAKN